MKYLLRSALILLSVLFVTPAFACKNPAQTLKSITELVLTANKTKEAFVYGDFRGRDAQVIVSTLRPNSTATRARVFGQKASPSSILIIFFFDGCAFGGRAMTIDKFRELWPNLKVDKFPPAV